MPDDSVGGSYGLGALGFLVLALFTDPFLSGVAMSLSSRIVENQPTSPRELVSGLGLRYRALLAWTWFQALVALLGLYNLMQILSPSSSVPEFFAFLAAALSFWAWLLLRAMNVHLPYLLVEETVPLRKALQQAFLTVISRPGQSMSHMVFRFGLSLLLLISGVGIVLGLGSFCVLHGFTTQTSTTPPKP